MTVRRRLTTSTALIALAAVLVLGIPLGAVEAARVRSEQTGRLEREADAVASVIDDRLEHGLPLTSAQLAPLVRPRPPHHGDARGGRTVTAGTRARRRDHRPRRDDGCRRGQRVGAHAARSTDASCGRGC